MSDKEYCPDCNTVLNYVGERGHYVQPPYSDEVSPDFYMFNHYYCRNCKGGMFLNEHEEFEDE
tara:strand:+ start:2026 stop:2214 length:189 start_codon:yes stop_codon:yes gene_type:complete